MTSQAQNGCFLCKRRAAYGKHFAAWNVTICQGCYHNNWDGVMPRAWPHLLPYLETNNCPIEYTASGTLRWPA